MLFIIVNAKNIELNVIIVANDDKFLLQSLSTYK